MKAVRILLAALAAALLVYALTEEEHEVRLAGRDEVLRYTGPEFVAAASVDRFVRGEDGRLYDRRSLALAAQPAPPDGDDPDGAPGEPPGDGTPPSFGKDVDIDEDCPT